MFEDSLRKWADHLVTNVSDCVRMEAMDHPTPNLAGFRFWDGDGKSCTLELSTKILDWWSELEDREFSWWGELMSGIGQPDQVLEWMQTKAGRVEMIRSLGKQSPCQPT